MISAVLLCAGSGKRMGRPKALLEWQGRTLVTHALDVLNQTRVDEIVVVTGPEREAIERELAQTHGKIPLHSVWNERHRSGMMTSIHTGIRVLDPATEAFFIALVDLPAIKPADYDFLIGRFQGGEGKLLRFKFQNTPCHPVLISMNFAAEILRQPNTDRGCSFLFDDHPSAAYEMDSRRGLLDLDRIEDYHAHVAP